MSRHVPYAPMRQAPLASDAEVKAMLARLKRRTEGGDARAEDARELAANPRDVTAGAASAENTRTIEPGGGGVISPGEQPDGAGRHAVSKPSPTASIITWEKPEKGATGVYSTCRRYSCAKVTVKGKVIYELRRLVPGDTWYIRVPGDFHSFAEVQAAAQKLEDEP